MGAIYLPVEMTLPTGEGGDVAPSYSAKPMRVLLLAVLVNLRKVLLEEIERRRKESTIGTIRGCGRRS